MICVYFLLMDCVKHMDFSYCRWVIFRDLWLNWNLLCIRFLFLEIGMNVDMVVEWLVLVWRMCCNGV